MKKICVSLLLAFCLGAQSASACACGPLVYFSFFRHLAGKHVNKQRVKPATKAVKSKLVPAMRKLAQKIEEQNKVLGQVLSAQRGQLIKYKNISAQLEKINALSALQDN